MQKLKLFYNPCVFFSIWADWGSIKVVVIPKNYCLVCILGLALPKKYGSDWMYFSGT